MIFILFTIALSEWRFYSISRHSRPAISHALTFLWHSPLPLPDPARKVPFLSLRSLMPVLEELVPLLCAMIRID
ncbi:MAG TPA: hypothetical protein PKY10_15640, partial [Lentisphaeria bacterium]|nr:hypothetical protein [Lentisphaeria bacterium]